MELDCIYEYVTPFLHFFRNHNTAQHSTALHATSGPLPPVCNFCCMAERACGSTRAAEKVTARLSNTSAACFLSVHLADTTSSSSSLSCVSFRPLLVSVCECVKVKEWTLVNMSIDTGMGMRMTQFNEVM